MRKYLLILVTLVLITTCITAVSAADTNNTEELTDTATYSQDSNIVTNDIDSPTKIDTDNKYTETSEPENTDGDDCCSAIVQGYNNNSAISFRRDSTSAVTLNVTHNSSMVKQCKSSGTYFFHVLISKDGWIVGNGGLDNTTTCHQIENYAVSMINDGKISDVTFNNIVNLKKGNYKGHFVIKAPNGTYALYINNDGNTKRETGTLLPGQYLVVPNDPTYFHKGYFQDVISTTNLSTASRLLAARDMYNVNRRDIVTYYVKLNDAYTQVKIYACNDDGRYVNKSTGNLVDSIRTNTQYFPASSIPAVPNSIVIDEFDLITRKINTTIQSENLTTNDPTITLKASVKDEYGNPVNYGFVSVLVNDKTLKYSNGTDATFNVINGTVSVKIRIVDIWKRKNHTYQFRYFGKNNYESKLGNKAVITLANLVNLNTSHAKSTNFGTNVTITANVNFKLNGSKVNDGKVLFKINGKTIKNKNGTTLTVDVKNGTAKYNFILDPIYSPRNYTITVVYSNGYCREERNSTLTVNKLHAKIISPDVKVTNKVLYVKAKLVDDTNRLIKYNTSVVSIKINGNTIRDSTGNARTFNIVDGIIDFNFTLSANYKKGNYTLTLVIPERKPYYSLRQNYTMTVI